MNHKEPKISVIVPTYNRAAMLGGCIESILSQTMDDFELVIVSDGSSDNTKEVVDSYHDPRIVFLKKENGGQASARNLGILQSRGKYISLCDDDDRFYQDHLLSLTEILEKETDSGLVYSDSLWIYKNSLQDPEVKYSREFDKKALENFNYITPLNVLFRRSCSRKTGFFNEDPGFKGLEDWEFFLRLSDQYPFLHLKQVTAEYHVHGMNSFKQDSMYNYNRAFLLVRSQRFHHLISMHGPRLFDHTDHMYAYYLVQCYMNNGRYAEALETANRLHQLYLLHDKKGNSITELVLLFSLGISSFAAGNERDARTFFNGIRLHPVYHQIKERFLLFARQYANGITETGLKVLMNHYFESGVSDE